MITNIYAILDTKAEAFGQPFFMLTDGLAGRAFTQAVLAPESEFSKYPLDFILYKIGDYDDETGKINSINPVELFSAHAAISIARKEHEGHTEISQEASKKNEETHRNNGAE